MLEGLAPVMSSVMIAARVHLSCRIVITDLQGKFIDQLGGNGPLLRDGSFEEAGFSRPQGLAFASVSNSLYVADTESHALRKVQGLTITRALH